MNAIDQIAEEFPIGRLKAVTEIKSGLMHSTYLVDSDEGQFTLQRLHKKLATHEIIGDFEAVTGFLYDHKLIAPRLIRTTADQPVFVDKDLRWWRMASWVPGYTKTKVQSAIEAEQGARALGRFHKVVAHLDHDFASQHPLHDTRAHLAGLKDAIQTTGYASALELIKPEIDQILDQLPSLILPDSLPQRVVHGDPKISNILFNGDVAIGLIDLDTCNRHTVLVDIGDAVRSWCRDGSEDEQQHFRIDRFESILAGYAADGLELTEHELDYLPQAARTITMELACRFARDVMVDDYFAFDTERYPSRRAHNIARTRAMLFLANDMRQQAEQINSLISHYFR